MDNNKVYLNNLEIISWVLIALVFNMISLSLCNLLVFFTFLIEASLIYKVVLVSGVQQSDSVIHIYIYMSFF